MPDLAKTAKSNSNQYQKRIRTAVLAAIVACVGSVASAVSVTVILEGTGGSPASRSGYLYNPWSATLTYDTGTAQVTDFSMTLDHRVTPPTTFTGVDGSSLDIASSYITVGSNGAFEIGVTFGDRPTVTFIDSRNGLERTNSIERVNIFGSQSSAAENYGTLDARLFDETTWNTSRARNFTLSWSASSGSQSSWDTRSFSTDAAPVPLPAGAALLLSALGGLAVLRRRKSRGLAA